MSMSESESRYLTVMRGVKEGALKGVVDTMVEKMSQPICQMVLPQFQQKFPDGAHLLEPAVRAALEFIIIMGIAELFAFAAPTVGKLVPSTTPEEAVKKGQLLAIWLRKYAGERVGEQLIQAATAIIPMVMEQFSGFTSSDLAAVLQSDEVTSVTEPSPQV